MANQAIVNNNYGEGVSPQNRGDTPCPQENAAQKQGQMAIDHADNQPWPMENVDSMVEKVKAQKQRKTNKKSN